MSKPYLQTISSNHTSKNRSKKLFPRSVFSYSILTQSINTHLTVPRAPFSRSVIPFRHSITPSLRFCLHSDNPKIVSIPTIHSNNPRQQTVFQQSTSTNSIPTIHVNKQYSNNPRQQTVFQQPTFHQTSQSGFQQPIFHQNQHSIKEPNRQSVK